MLFIDAVHKAIALLPFDALTAKADTVPQGDFRPWAETAVAFATSRASCTISMVHAAQRVALRSHLAYTLTVAEIAAQVCNNGFFCRGRRLLRWAR